MKKLFFLMALIFSPRTFSHGENQLGPHHGYVRMPGTFHTELVEKNQKTLEVYLLDINFKNPVIENSKVIIKLEGRSGQEIKAITCLPQKEKMNFQCHLEDKASLYQKIKIEATRNSVKSNQDATYELPLKLDHSKNH